MPADTILSHFRLFLQKEGYLSAFSDSEWAELERLTRTPRFDAPQHETYWKNLLTRWITRNHDPRRNIYQELVSIQQVYIDLLKAHTSFAAEEIVLLRLYLSESEIEQSFQQMRFLQFECQQRHDRIRALETESEQTRAEYYALIELNLFISENLHEEETIQRALDGLLGILDAGWTALLLLEDDDDLEQAVLHRYRFGGYDSLRPFPLKTAPFWRQFFQAQVFSRQYDDILLQIPDNVTDIEPYFPEARSLIVNQLRIADHQVGLFIATSSEPAGLSGFLRFVNIISTNIASSIQNARLHARINEMAIRDGITGLYNRRYFEERFEQNLARCKRYHRELSVIMVDIDKFKNINDTYGHQTGDMVLKTVAHILKERLRTTDIIGRYGGEEFIIILDETGLKGAEKVAVDLVKEVSLYPIDIERQEPLFVTISAGYSSYPSHGDQTPELISGADQGLYQAKQTGRNRVGFIFA